jgi:DNA (cytosine-5)-methyltransferase 1
MGRYSVAEFCVGGGGQALGLEAAGFECAAAVEIDPDCCTTLRLNRPQWNVLQEDMRRVDGGRWKNIDLFAAGVPCPPFSIAGKQLGTDDDRDLFPEAIRIVQEMKPKAVMLENVPGFASAKFSEYREKLRMQLLKLGYESDWRVLQAADYGVPQLRPRFIMVALPKNRMQFFDWPQPIAKRATVGDALRDLMAQRGWNGAQPWAEKACKIAPTVVGGSKKHGGPDLGPTRARKQWRELGVDGLGIANEPPPPDFPLDAFPRLTVRMVARIQGFPDFWKFSGKKTAAYRQVGNAFPPPVASFVGLALANAMEGRYPTQKRHGRKAQRHLVALPSPSRGPR